MGRVPLRARLLYVAAVDARDEPITGLQGGKRDPQFRALSYGIPQGLLDFETPALF